MIHRTASVASALFAAAVLIGSSLEARAAEVYEIDPAHADVVFMVSHFGLSDTVGRIGDVSGEIVLDEENMEENKVEVTMKAASLDTNHAKRDEHLRSADFFNVEKYPEITFESTKVEKTGENTGRVTGDLTLLGVTGPVTLDVTLNARKPHPIPDYEGREVVGFSASGTLMRTDFGMDKFAPAIGDEVELTLEVEALAKK